MGWEPEPRCVDRYRAIQLKEFRRLESFEFGFPNLLPFPLWTVQTFFLTLMFEMVDTLTGLLHPGILLSMAFTNLSYITKDVRDKGPGKRGYRKSEIAPIPMIA